MAFHKGFEENGGLSGNESAGDPARAVWTKT